MPRLDIRESPPSFGSEFGRNLGAGISRSVEKGISSKMEEMFKSRELDNREREFVQRGYPPQLARLAAVSTTGGQTEALKYLLEGIKRGGSLPLTGQDQNAPQDLIDQSQSQQEPSFQSDQEIGLVPSEKVKRQESLYKNNLPIFSEAKNKLNAYEQERGRIDRLNALNETGKLPSNLGRLNVDFKTGNLQLPAAANPETQAFVKTVNDFISGAKDTFGSRVTNFDLSTFLQRLPTLANTEEGRRGILRQMQIINELNAIENRGIIDSYNELGGIRKADFDKVSNLADKKTKEEKEKLLKEYKTINKNFGKKQQLQELPDPSKYKGKRIQNEESGQILMSDGKEWKPVGK